MSIETFFLLSLLKNGITDFTPEGSTTPVRSLSKIYSKYVKEGLVYDLLPLLPVTLCFIHHNKYVRLFYLVKIGRINKLKNV